MAPRRRLPDLCGIALLKMMPSADQLRAGKMNKRWTGLLRAANRRVRSLKIICVREDVTKESLDFFHSEINALTLGGNSSSMQMLTNDDGKLQYPVTGSLTKWNVLEVQFPSKNKEEDDDPNVFSVQQIANAYSAITELTFSTRYPDDFGHLVEMLEQYSQLTRQLTSLTLIDRYDESILKGLSPALNRRLFALINTGMPALERLAISWEKGLKMVQDLPVIAQLKVLSAQCFNPNFDDLLYSLEQYAENAVDLQVILHSNNNEGNEEVYNLSKHARDRIVRCWKSFDLSKQELLLQICDNFRSLVSFGLHNTEWRPEWLLANGFTALAHLPQLVHLSLLVDIIHRTTRPLTVLPSVRALDLNLTITDHNQADWLNLNSTLPNLEVIHIANFFCGRCNAGFHEFDFFNSATRSTALECLRAVLPRLHSGVLLSRIFLEFDNNRTAEEVCNITEEE